MLNYKSISIWYFSGTGNAQFAANQIAEFAKEMGAGVDIQSITKGGSGIPPVDPKTLMGFCYPTHGFNAPPAVLKFLVFFYRNQANT